MRSFNSVGIPWLSRFQRSHKHFIHTQRISTELVHNNIRVNNVAARFTHLLIVRSQNHSLVDKLLEWLFRRYDAKIIQHFVPETGIK
ncbi:hypothetical protein D3C77_553910 [compost metagenome]